MGFEPKLQVLASLCVQPSIHVPQQRAFPVLRTIFQVSPRAYFAARGSGLSLEGLCVIAPHAAVGLDVAFARHTDLGGLQKADAG